MAAKKTATKAKPKQQKGKKPGFFSKIRSSVASMSFAKKGIIFGSILAIVGVGGFFTYNYVSDSSADASALTNCGTLRYGSRNSCVTELQKQLNTKYNYCSTSRTNLATDGIFGPLTKASVVAYQKAKGLSADGIAGPMTQSKLAGDGTRCSAPSTSSKPKTTTVSKGYVTVLSDANFTLQACKVNASVVQLKATANKDQNMRIVKNTTISLTANSKTATTTLTPLKGRSVTVKQSYLSTATGIGVGYQFNYKEGSKSTAKKAYPQIKSLKVCP